MTDALLWYVRKQPLFADLGPGRLRQLADAAEWIELGRDVPIYAPGDPADRLYVVVGGRVRRSQPTTRGAVTLGYYGARQCFGEECVLSDMPRETFAEVSLPSKLLAIPRAVMTRLVSADRQLHDRLLALIKERKIDKSRYEFAMLYGINTPRQLELAKRGERIRCLVAYGEYWFPWYMRRLGERPANVWFVVKNIFKG